MFDSVSRPFSNVGSLCAEFLSSFTVSSPMSPFFVSLVTLSISHRMHVSYAPARVAFVQHDCTIQSRPVAFERLPSLSSFHAVSLTERLATELVLEE